MGFDSTTFNRLPCLHPAIRGSLRSFDWRRQYLADPRETGCAFHRAGVSGYFSRCPSGKSKTIHFISALFILKYQSRRDAYLSQARLNVCG
jgi:hypothetical protein